MQNKRNLLGELTPRQTRQIATCYSTFLLNGVLALAIGTLLPYVRQSAGLDYVFAGVLVSLHSIGNLISGFAAGMLPLAIGRRKSVLLFSASYTLAFVLMLLSGSRPVLAVAFLLTGIARGAASNFNNVMVNEILPGRAWALNTLHASFAVGALLSPMLVLLCAERFGNWRLMCGVMILCGLIEFVLYASMPLSATPPKKAKQGQSNYGFLRKPQFWITTGTLFFYLCTEQGVIGWLVTYFQDAGILSAGYAQTMASVLWVLILAGRLFVAWLSTRVDPHHLLIAMGAGIVFFFLLLWQSRSLPVITLGIAGFGFSMAGIYPTSVSLCGGVMKRYPLCWSVILTVASLGSILMPSVIGAVAEKTNIAVGMGTILVTLGITLGMILLNNFIRQKEE